MQQTFNLFPERWSDLYREEVLGEIAGVVPGDEEIPLTENDMDALDAFLAQQEQGAMKRWMRAGQLPPEFELDTQGTRV